MHSFAVIELIRDITEVPVKLKLMHRTPGFMPWYIKRFNPFTAEKMELLGGHGFLVRLPLTEADMRERPDFFTELAERTLESLRDYGVVIVLPPTEQFPQTIPHADGRRAFALFMIQAVEKALKLIGKDIKTAELLLIDGDYGLADGVLDNIYPHVNYLTVLTDRDYERKVARIFDDCGLNVHASELSRSALSNADVIINTRERNNKFDYHYKRGAIYFDLARGVNLELAAKRADIMLVDGLRIREPGGGGLDLPRLECGLYASSGEYRAFAAGRGGHMHERIKALGYCVTGLSFRNKPASLP